MSVQTTLSGEVAKPPRAVVKKKPVKRNPIAWEFTCRREMEFCRPPPQKYTKDTDLITVAPPRHPYVRNEVVLNLLEKSMPEDVHKKFTAFNLKPRPPTFEFIYPEDLS